MRLISKMSEIIAENEKTNFLAIFEKLLNSEKTTINDIKLIYKAIKKDPFNLFPECHKSKKPKLKFENLEWSEVVKVYGKYNREENVIEVNTNSLNPESILETIDTIIHEYTHFMQHVVEDKRSRELKKDGLLTKVEEESFQTVSNLDLLLVVDALYQLKSFKKDNIKFLFDAENDKSEIDRLNFVGFGIYSQREHEVDAREKSYIILSKIQEELSEKPSEKVKTYLNYAHEQNNKMLASSELAINMFKHVFLKEIEWKEMARSVSLDFITASVLSELLLISFKLEDNLKFALTYNGSISKMLVTQLLANKDTKFQLIDRWLNLIESGSKMEFTYKTENRSICETNDCKYAIESGQIERSFTSKEIEDIINGYIANGKYIYVVNLLSVYTCNNNKKFINKVYSQVQDMAIEDMNRILENKKLAKKVEEIYKIKQAFENVENSNGIKAKKVDEYFESISNQLVQHSIGEMFST